MGTAYKLDCESAVSDSRFVVQSENESEALELAKRHMKDVHEQELTADELREDYLVSV